jgi:hypothetical protein
MTKRSKLALAVLAAALVPMPVWAAPNTTADNGLVGFNALNLTPAQQRSIYQAIGDTTQVVPPEHYLIHVGGTVPTSIKLQPLPEAATRQTPRLKGDDYVKLDEGDVLLVKPQDRSIVEVIDRYHGTAGAAAG